MSQRSFNVLLILSLGITFMAVAVRLSSPDYTGQTLGTEIAMGDLANQINDVGLVSITTADDTLTITRGDGGAWLVEERGGYPADTQKVQEAVLALSRLTLHEKKTTNTARYHRLDLDRVGKATQVFITTDDGTMLVDAVIGKRVTAQSGLPKGGVYLRQGDDPQTWLAAGPLNLGSDIKDWIETVIVNVPAQRIDRISYFHSDGDTLMLERSGGLMTLLDIPEDHQIDSDYRVSSISKFLEELRIDDVHALSSDPGVAIVTVAYETMDGLRVDLDMFGNDEGGDWLQLDASGRTAETITEADGIKARTSGWAFKITDWKSATLTHRLADLIKPIAAD